METLDDAAGLLGDYQSQVQTCLVGQQWIQALSLLTSCEKQLEKLKARGETVGIEAVLWTLHNVAVCHRLLGASKVCANYLDACAFNAREKLAVLCASSQSFSVAFLCERVLTRKYLATTYIQLCALFSEQQRHDLALNKARQAAKEAQFFIKESLAASYESLAIAKRKRLDSLESAVKKAIPLYEYIQNKFLNKKTKKVPKLQTRNALGVVSLDDPVFSFQISDLMVMKPAHYHDFAKISSAAQLFTRAEVFESISVCIVAQFCVATELRFLYGETGSTSYLKEAQIWHLRSLRTAMALLPEEAPILEHLRVSFTTNYDYKKTKDSSKKLISSKQGPKKLGETSMSRRSRSPNTKQTRSKSARPFSRPDNLKMKLEPRESVQSISKNFGSKKELADRTVDLPMTDRSETVLDMLLSQFDDSKDESTPKSQTSKQLAETTRPETATVSGKDSRMSEITQPEPTPPPKLLEKLGLSGVLSIAEESSASIDELIFTSGDLYGVYLSDYESGRTTLHPDCSVSSTPMRTPPRNMPSIQLLKKQEARLKRLN